MLASVGIEVGAFVAVRVVRVAVRVCWRRSESTRAFGGVSRVADRDDEPVLSWPAIQH